VDNDLTALEAEPTVDRATGDGDDTPQVDVQAKDRGWLDWPEAKLARHLWRLWKSINQPMQRRIIQGQVNERRRQGEAFVGITKDPDSATYRIYSPPDSARVPPSLSKAPRLCRRITAQLFQDPPLPEAVPARDDDEARDAAELSTRLLGSIDSEAGTNGLATARRAFDRVHAWGSGFRYHYVDIQGGGATPKTILASMDAQTADEALERTEQAVDLTGQPADRVVQLPGPFVPRFVRPDGTLTDDAREAEEVWLPKICHEVHTPRTFRMLPASALHISEAQIGLLLSIRSWADVRRTYPQAEQATEEQQKKIVSWRPDGIRDLLPPHLREKDLEGSERTDGKLADDALCVLLLAYVVAGAECPDGLYATVGGGKFLLERTDWRYVNEETGKTEPLDIPVDQFKGWEEGQDDPYGVATLNRLGAGDELLAQIDSARIAHFQRLGNRKTFLPYSSSISSKSLQATTATVIGYSGGKPEYEELPTFPQDLNDFREMIAGELTDESGLQPAAQGQDTPNIQSGFHAVQMIEQSIAGQSELHQNAADALARGWRIDLQLMRAFFSGAHLLQMVGIDGAVKVKHWTAADLGDTSDVRLLRGTFSMMTPSMKSSIALAMTNAGLLSKEGLQRATAGNTGGLLALQDDPHILRVRQQTDAWLDGPPTDTEGAPDPTAPDPFDYRAVDDQADVAPLRATELGRAMASPKYLRKPPAWQQYLTMAYQRAVAAASGQPMPPPSQAPATQLPPGATPGAVPQTPPIVGQPISAPGSRLPQDATAGLTEPAPPASPVLEGGDPRLNGQPVGVPASTLPQ
jgi:hypothetical protein